MTTDDFPAAYARLQLVTNTRTQSELAAVLGIRQSSISDAKRRRDIPASWLLAVLKRYRVNPEWIQTGYGSQYLTGEDEQPLDELRVNWHALGSEIEHIVQHTHNEIVRAVKAATQS